MRKRGVESSERGDDLWYVCIAVGKELEWQEER